MKKAAISIFLIAIVTFFCHGQSFLSRYPQLNKKNLSEFFTNWQTYSDSIYSNNVITDSVLTEIIKFEYAVFQLESRTTKFCVVPQKIKVERYYLDVDTVMARLEHGFPSYIPEMKDGQFAVDNITPILPYNGVYLTSGINKLLSAFGGGIKKDDKIAKINKGNVRRIEKYIPVHYGHWGGYWWFTSFPLITNIYYANNLIAIMRRTSWCTGDVIWYIKKDGEFIRQQEPVTSWIE